MIDELELTNSTQKGKCYILGHSDSIVLKKENVIYLAILTQSYMLDLD